MSREDCSGRPRADDAGAIGRVNHSIDKRDGSYAIIGGDRNTGG